MFDGRRERTQHDEHVRRTIGERDVHDATGRRIRFGQKYVVGERSHARGIVPIVERARGRPGGRSRKRELRCATHALPSQHTGCGGRKGRARIHHHAGTEHPIHVDGLGLVRARERDPRFGAVRRGLCEVEPNPRGTHDRFAGGGPRADELWKRRRRRLGGASAQQHRQSRCHPSPHECVLARRRDGIKRSDTLRRAQAATETRSAHRWHNLARGGALKCLISRMASRLLNHAP